MLNKYPLWKNLLIVCIVCFTALYAIPNLFGEDHAVQISGIRGQQVTEETLSRVQKILQQHDILIKKAELTQNKLQIRLVDPEQQLQTKELLVQNFGDNYVTALNFASTTPDSLTSIGASPMRLGLDLRGGIHFLLEVDMKEVVHKARTQVQTDLRSGLRSQKIRYSGISALNEGVLVKFRSDEIRNQAEEYIRTTYRRYKVAERGQHDLWVALSEEELKLIRKEALTQNITIIRNRVNELGVAEPMVQRQGAERIIVQLPGVQDSSRAKQILGSTATLEFRFVNTKVSPDDMRRHRLPVDTEVFDVRQGGQAALYKKVILSGDHITNARASFDEYNQPQVSIDLDSTGGSMMSEATKGSIGTLMATLFTEYRTSQIKNKDGNYALKKVEEVVSQATIQARLGRSFRITGLDYDEAKTLALLLRAGALKAPVQIVEERTIGPSMGQKNIDSGLKAMICGLIAVVLFMLLYYRSFGLVTNLVLVINLVMIIGLLSMIPGATLTLPGIAGIVLTVGMAVDGNVLIFERIREELRLGRPVQRAISEGYGNAFSTIADANITTFVTSLILFAVGTGAVKGFAVTLMIGIATSMFTVIVVSRAIVNGLWGGKRLKKLSI